MASKPKQPSDADVLLAAINFAIEHPDDGIAWLRAWTFGDPEAMGELAAKMAKS